MHHFIKKTLILSCGLLSLCFANLSEARPAEVFDVADPQLILNLARGEGRADLIQEQGKDPVVRGKINGINYALFFTSCENNANCKSLEFILQINADKKKPFKLDVVNRLNREYTGLTSYLDTNKNLIVARTLYFNGGITQEHIDHFIRLNRLIVEAIQGENLYK